MATIFDSLFDGKEGSVSLNPMIPLDGFTFILKKVEPYREWVLTGDIDSNGNPRRAPSDELVTDETGKRCRCVLSLQLKDANGRTTSPASPFVDRKHYFDEKTVKYLIGHVGHEIELDNPRIEFIDATQKIDKRDVEKHSFGNALYGNIETKMVFVFDGVKA